MRAEPIDWNVVVAGAWNTAILTPEGIKKRLFRLEDKEVVKIEVAIDAPGPFRVIHDGIIVVPTSSTLLFATEHCDGIYLKRSAEFATRALEELPHTPVGAVGVNIRYKFSEVSEALTDFIKAPVDERLSDIGFEIQETSIKRSLRVKDGVVNFELGMDESQDGFVFMNFHLGSKENQKLISWLKNIDEFLQVSEKLLSCINATDVNH